MKSSQRIEALSLVKAELEAWLSYQPSWHFKLHGCKEANIAYQQLKTLLQYEINQSSLDNDVDVEIYFADDLESNILDESLGLHNDK
jgi:hypothetical protein